MNYEDTVKTYSLLLNDVLAELNYADNKFPGNYNSPHEGYAILKEEVDELWEAIRAGQKPRLFGSDRQSEEALRAIRVECIQVAAMAVRLAQNLQGQFKR